MISGEHQAAGLGIRRLQQECNAVVWDPAKGAENISQAEQAKVGVVYAEYGLTESGGVVLFRRRAWAFIEPAPGIISFYPA